MKNKKSTIGLMLLMAGSLVLTNCTKNKTNEAPEPDTDMKAVTEVVTTQMILSDIIEIASPICEGVSLYNYHDCGSSMNIVSGGTAVTTGSYSSTAQLTSKYYEVTFNKTLGRDGHIRNGVLRFDFSPTVNSATYDHFRLPTFDCNVIATGYSIDNYTLQVNSMNIKNVTPDGFPTTSPYLPALGTKLSWKQTSNVTFLNGSSSSSFNGSITKTIENTNNQSIPMPAGYSTNYTVTVYPSFSYLSYDKCYNSYKGEGTGTLSDGTPYTMTISDAAPLTRNMVSKPTTFSTNWNSTLNAYDIITAERHPFLTGLMTIKAGSKAERLVNFGGAAEVVDYNAKVTIAGITYDLDITQ